MTAAPDPRALADAVLGALDRLACSLGALTPEDVDELSRAIGSTRRAVAVELAGRVDQRVAAYVPPAGHAADHEGGDGEDQAEDHEGLDADGRADLGADGGTDEGDAAGDEAVADDEDVLLALGDGPSIAAGVMQRRDRLAAALDETLSSPAPPDRLVDDLRALLAHVELVHVSLEVGYELDDLPPESTAACEHVLGPPRHVRDASRPRSRPRPIPHRRRGIAWPPGRRSP